MMAAELLINNMVQFIGFTAVFILAYQSYQKRRIQLGTEPTLPQYFNRRYTYWIGITLYCTLMAVICWLITRMLTPLVNLIVNSLHSGKLVELLNGLDSRTIIPLIITGLFFFLLTWESRFNPLLMLRDGIHDTFAMPATAVAVYHALITSRLSAIDESLKDQIANRLLVPSIESGDFDKSSATVEYKWAHNCLLFDQIHHYAKQSSYRRFFNEPSLKWGEICISYNAMSEKVIVWKEAEPHYTKTLKLINELDHLTGLLSRLLASLVVFGSANEHEIWETVRRLGGNTDDNRLQHTYKYLLIFTAVTAIGVMIGREISVSLHNIFLFPNKPLAHFNYTTLRWVAYAILMYVVPIALIFVVRQLTFRKQQERSDFNYGFYIVMMMMGFIVSTTTSTLILELTYYKNDYSFLESFIQHMRWGILPALMCGFVAYRMDITVSEPETLSKRIWHGILRFVGWGIVAIIIMLYATDDLTLEETNLRFILVGTAFFVVGSLGASIYFKSVDTAVSQDQINADKAF